jgi:hypothetical protein
LSGDTSIQLFDHLVGNTSSDSGAVRPSALAVLRLIVGSNLVGCDIVAVEHRFEMYEG